MNRLDLQATADRVFWFIKPRKQAIPNFFYEMAVVSIDQLFLNTVGILYQRKRSSFIRSHHPGITHHIGKHDNCCFSVCTH